MGHHGTYGWVADGRSELAETELVRRLSHICIKRSRDDIWKSTPPKTRQIIRLESKFKDDQSSIQAKLRSEKNLWSALEKTLEHKVDDICENVMEELINGQKAIIWVLTRNSVEIMTSAMEKVTSARNWGPRMREVQCRIWATHGEADVKVRFDVAADYRNHKGAGVIIATMDSLPESISLFGASTEHYAQLHFLPGPMEQSENRPYLRGTSRLHILYYVLKDSCDERVLSLLMPRLVTAELIGASKDAGAQSLALAEKVESFDDFLARLTASAPEDYDMDFEEEEFEDTSGM